MLVNPGRLDKKITIKRKAALPTHHLEVDSEGFPVSVSEITVRSCWAQVTRTSGTEIIRADSQFSQEQTRFLVRWSAKKIDTDCWIEYGGTRYDIRFVNDYGDAHEYQEIWATVTERR